MTLKGSKFNRDEQQQQRVNRRVCTGLGKSSKGGEGGGSVGGIPPWVKRDKRPVLLRGVLKEPYEAR